MDRLMQHVIKILLIFVMTVVPFAGSTQEISPSSVARAREILAKVDDMWRGESSRAVITMNVKTEHYQRHMKMEAWSKGTEKTLVTILSPLKEKGTATLKSANHIYSYLPKTDRTIRLTSGMMTGSWMGSHFTNDDLVRESRMEEDYTPAVTFEGNRDGMDVIDFTLIPKEDAAIVWGKVLLSVRAKDYLPLVEIFYDEDMVETRRMVFSDFKMMAGAERPAVMRVIPTDKPDEYTELIYLELDLDPLINDNFFSLNRLRQSR